jgi:hypothetical protein
MKCDQCGQEIRAQESSLSSTVDKPDFRMEANPGYTRTTPLNICEACAASRKGTERFFAWTVAIAIGGLVVVAILIKIFS